ncbi:hypothetical protein [Pseudomonas amygdali]|uniref:Uncharacterized protein n=1 Tax=Pseudomonas amygdali pv. lachrymans str. M301315 TaxID=629260 RepID=A0AAD0V9P9_PSEAV|nr:hypothetical protein [Pseudomonas amygdali]AXH59844.1 hypothetical protein PLA107_031975 [Pseudomonas amygdali pv. lachrymans str. M301315]RMT06380.1 hypothetical protein ALP54_03725 [Pseudomonas amygdali pv. lachrymans]
MKVLLNLKTCEEIDLEDLQPVNLNTPLTLMIKALVDVIGQHPDLQDVQPILAASNYPHLEFPGSESAITVDIHLSATSEEIDLILDRDMDNCLGVFATSSGFFDRERWTANRFRVLMACDEQELREHMKLEASEDRDEGRQPRYETYLVAYLITLTHELAHAVEFIRHGAGLTPEEVESAWEDGSLDLSVSDVCSGRGIREDMPCDMDEDVANEVMEERVEAQGIEWLEWALDRLPAEYLRGCTKAYGSRMDKRNCERYEISP